MSQQPSLMKIPFAQNGAKATIPETTTSLGVASLSQGFPTETQLPLANGGVPPRRIDVNGALYMLSTFAMYQQTGGKFTWSSELDYDVPCIIYHNSNLWWCVQANGLSTNIVEPGTNRAYWIPFKEFVSSPLDAYPVGAYYISSSPTSPATLFGGTWVQVKDRMILAVGDTYKSAGLTGGSATTKLVVNNIPSHNHSCGTAGNHSHTGTTSWGGEHTHTFTYPNKVNPDNSITGSSAGHNETWNTSPAGGHTHTLTTNTTGNHNHTIGNTGSGTAFNTISPYITAYVWRRTA